MLPDGPALLLIIALALGYALVEKVKEPINKTGKTICHVVTFGHKCKAPDDKPQP